MNEAAAVGTDPPADNGGSSTALPQLATPPTVFNSGDDGNGSHDASSDGDGDNDTDDNVEQLLLQHDKDEEQNLQQQIEEETHKHTDMEEVELADCANVPTDERLKELKSVHITNPSGQTLFGNEKSQRTKKRSRQRLSDDAKIDLAYDALEGMRAVKVLLEATIKPIETHSDPTVVVGLVIECLRLAVGKMESCASALELACANTSSKKYASHAHRKLGGESRRRQKGEQLLMRGIGKTSAADALGHALANAKATFARLSPEPSSEPQQPLSTRRRVAAIQSSINPSEIHLPPPAEGHKIYSLHQAMSIVEARSRDDSVSVRAVLKEMIRRQLVPVKLTALYYNVKKYVGSDKPEAPMYWAGGILGGGQEIMPVGDLKKHFLAHQSERIGRQWLKKDTAKVLFDAKLANAARMGIDASCIKQPDAKTVSTYHSTLMSMPEVTRRAGAYKPEHRDIGVPLCLEMAHKS